ncbi:hypothetical protein [Trichoplusia ni ascovirus 2c]|uniref:hypothetical protein n=1 Tax=Trichoplusia ni ascovirus 2c TaxID=328615 RepID=UPI0000E44253|nr:hypothetical protein TNAV2c_gp123 [Trichoplusia ni ascovirus 2c]ABF70640.1 hypothetical protein [Trichoplusia ni ascovirus 2c]
MDWLLSGSIFNGSENKRIYPQSDEEDDDDDDEDVNIKEGGKDVVIMNPPLVRKKNKKKHHKRNRRLPSSGSGWLNMNSFTGFTIIAMVTVIAFVYYQKYK